MDSEIKTWLYDIMQSIKEIESYFQDKPKKFEDYNNDIKTKRAVERNIEIIGEAANRIMKRDKEFKLENVHKIIGTRNRIAHGYDKISGSKSALLAHSMESKHGLTVLKTFKSLSS